ncbi:DUF5597 domain-containing protein [Sphingomonas nostoxanthinifaciens]|uniref:DUF5597 domain-containing protein n=1 Tax=Sphingomonas nostoxanthinifaciens TaxID=2872652 RepID=UPI001CC2070C|nr:DUF5597 domain-containing protein [Sphingomonas nostoxanthinifaciens]UAK26249.1 DUF5597 domain-containing protein [Sphingomonas nostoxanthinifaciens]
MAGAVAAFHLSAPALAASGTEIPRLAVAANGQRTLYVDGKPFFVLAAQIHNSSAWPDVMAQSMKAAADLHANTIEVPVYWEQLEPEPGRYDTSSVDQLIATARANGTRLVLLWFGTWKNGQNHYAPAWMRSDPAHYPRTIDERGEPADVQSPFSVATRDADERAYVTLLRHLKAVDGDRHTVIMMQVENEPGAIGAVRDHGPDAERAFAAPVPPALAAKLGKGTGTWPMLFGPDAAEAFNAYATATYIDRIAAAGRAVYPLPVYVNCWMRYKGFNSPGVDYPSGGAVWTMLDLWRAAAPNVEMIGTDVYTTDPVEYRKVLDQYHRADNPTWVSETDFSPKTAPLLYNVLALGGVGMSVFGIDNPDPSPDEQAGTVVHRLNYGLLAPISSLIAQAAAEKRIWAAVEEPGRARQTIDLPDGWKAVVSFGPPAWGATPAIIPNSKTLSGRIFMIRLAADQWLVGGSDVRVEFQRSGAGHGQLLRAEDGAYVDGAWHARRWLNGDETDFGLNLTSPGLIRVTTGQF